ncbi:hypothetical protein AB6A40_004666 [Gnathostoma spinigerum]|uniref:Arrestin C-terminal-like domain-containing protein n=1 Tax=Gnathostoma spinigerum TaxID=75299 RepID=A0ABD6EMM4_9BILA
MKCIKIEVRLVDRATRVGNAAATVPPLRTLLRRKLDTAESVKSKSSLQRDDILFLQIPAVAPSTAGIAEPMNLEMLSISPNLKSADSNFMRSTPATATLRFRKQAFIRIEYMIQVSLGTELLLELPITILPLPIKGPNIVYEPFAGGPQPIDESDEPVRGVNEESSMFTPLYPVFRSLSTVAATEISTESQPSQETNQVQQSNGESTNLANSDR